VYSQVHELRLINNFNGVAWLMRFQCQREGKWWGFWASSSNSYK